MGEGVLIGEVPLETHGNAPGNAGIARGGGGGGGGAEVRLRKSRLLPHSTLSPEP